MSEVHLKRITELADSSRAAYEEIVEAGLSALADGASLEDVGKALGHLRGSIHIRLKWHHMARGPLAANGGRRGGLPAGARK